MASIKTYPRTIILPPSEAFYCFQYFGVDNDSDVPTIQNIHENYREPLLYIFRTGEATWDVDCFLWESGGISELAIFSTVIKRQDGFTLKEVRRINVP